MVVGTLIRPDRRALVADPAACPTWPKVTLRLVPVCRWSNQSRGWEERQAAWDEPMGPHDEALQRRL